MMIKRDTWLFASLKWCNALGAALVFYLGRILRMMQIPNQYKKIKKYEGIVSGQGKRCFIIATGPSLTWEDLRKLRYEDTFGMNSLCKAFPQLGWETTYFGIQDGKVYKNFVNDIANLSDTIIFYGGTAKVKNNITEKCRYSINYLNHRFKLQTRSAKFRGDCYLEVFDGYSISYSLLQLAVYMGYKEIYLIGQDCNYSGGEKTHFIDNGNKGTKDVGDRMIYAFGEAKKYCDAHGVNVYNATRGGMLEVFPRVDLDEVLKRDRG